ncbi:Histidine kinase-, DNA gyrase B-, and HSP90-like ATPase [Xylophilus ampelinus]|nr:Histidine kinase-, DNA gyrase B-, and HSP90-like ATPase [Xylophilus ampelinus]
MTVEDDGHGMNAGQFKGRWMKLGYNRLKHQSALVEFPPERQGWRRKAYGRNGVGRHGLLCFADQYSVETWRGDKGASFDIGTQSEENPFRIEREGSFIRKGHGTKLSVIVQRHLPDADAIREILAGRFVHDPQFVVRVNGVSVALADQTGLIEKQDLQILGCPPAEAFVVDTTRTAKYTLYQGIAFWVNGRLVGVPSWVVGSEAVIDAGQDDRRPGAAQTQSPGPVGKDHRHLRIQHLPEALRVKPRCGRPDGRLHAVFLVPFLVFFFWPPRLSKHRR